MTFPRLALSALLIAGTATSCRQTSDRDEPVAVCRLVAEDEQPARELTAQQPTTPEPVAAPELATAPTPRVEPSPPLPTEPAPPPQPEPVPEPAPAPQAQAPVVIVMPQAQTQQQQPRERETTVHPGSFYPSVPPLYAPPAPATVSENGVVMPAVPLYIDPGAAPGEPGNGAPST